jgi:O-antigen ligase/Flp pilus assembly protein TadD
LGSRLGPDRIGFAVFASWVVLAFTTAIPTHFTLPKLLGLYAYAAFAAARWAAHAQHGQVRQPPHGLLVIAAACLFWWTLTTLTAQHLPTALFGIYGRHNGLLAAAAGLAILVSTATLRLDRDEIRRWLVWPAAALGAASGYAVLQALGLDPLPWPQGRSASTMGHPVIFGAALATVLPFVLASSFEAGSRLARAGWGSLAVLFVLALAVTLARGPWIAAAAGVVILLILAGLRRPAVLRAAAVGTAALVLAGGLTLVSSERMRSRVVDRVASFARLDRDSSVSSRLLFYRAALAMVRDHPVTGIGFENYALLYPRYRAPVTETVAPDVIPTMVHDGLLQAAASGGLPGLALYLLLPAAVGITVARRWRREGDSRERVLGAAFLASVAAFLVQDLSGWPDVALNGLTSAIWGLALAWSLAGAPASDRLPRWGVAVAFATAALAAWLAFDTAQRIRADWHLLEARRLDPRTAWTSARSHLETAVRASPDLAWAADAAAMLYLQRVALSADRQAYEEGCRLAARASLSNPFDPYMRIRRVELEIAALERKLVDRPAADAAAAYDAAIAMDPNNATVHEAGARLAFAAGDHTRALAGIRRALALRPGRARYHVVEGDVLRAMGDGQGMERAYRAGVAAAGPGTPESAAARRRLVFVLAQDGRHEEAVREAQTLVADHPSESLGWTLLGISLEALGSRAEARRAFERSLALDPSDPGARAGMERLARPPGPR